MFALCLPQATVCQNLCESLSHYGYKAPQPDSTLPSPLFYVQPCKCRLFQRYVARPDLIDPVYISYSVLKMFFFVNYSSSDLLSTVNATLQYIFNIWELQFKFFQIRKLSNIQYNVLQMNATGKEQTNVLKIKINNKITTENHCYSMKQTVWRNYTRNQNQESTRNTSIHPFSSTLSIAGSQGQHSKQRSPDPLPGHFLQDLCWNPKA